MALQVIPVGCDDDQLTALNDGDGIQHRDVRQESRYLIVEVLWDRTSPDERVPGAGKSVGDDRSLREGANKAHPHPTGGEALHSDEPSLMSRRLA